VTGTFIEIEALIAAVFYLPSAMSQVVSDLLFDRDGGSHCYSIAALLNLF